MKIKINNKGEDDDIFAKKKKEKSPKTKKIYQKDEDKIIPFELDKKGDSKKELIEIKKDVTDKKVIS